ncbi:MFS transporter [Bacillus sp. FJAT-50079]|nr:MFS transporter [Bacillus sp. FJAT-50079]
MLQLSMFNFFYYWAIAVVNAFIPLYLRYKGMGPGEIGIVLAVGPLVAIFSQPLWGVISDRRQNVKKIVLMLLVVTLFTSAALFYSSSLLLVIVAMMVFNFFMSPVQPLVDSMASAYAQDKGVSYGSIRFWGSIGFAFASFFIGYMIGKIGLQYLWFVYSTIIVISFIIASKLTNSQTKRAPITITAMKKTFQNPRYVGFLVAVLFIAIPTRMNDGMLGIYMKHLGATEGHVGMAWMVSSISEAPVIALLYLVMRRVPLLVLIGISGGFYTIRWLLYASFNDPTMLIISQAMHSVTFAILMVASVQYVATVVPREMLATGQTIYFATYSGLGAIIGNSVGGYLMEVYSASFVYQAGAVFAFIGMLICFAMQIKYKNQPLQEQSVA